MPPRDTFSARGPSLHEVQVAAFKRAAWLGCKPKRPMNPKWKPHPFA